MVIIATALLLGIVIYFSLSLEEPADVKSIDGGGAKGDEGSVLWNAWASPAAEPFSPKAHLAADAPALISLHLSSQDYGKWNSAVSSNPSSADLRHELDELLKNPHNTTAELKIVFLADPLFFDLPEG